MPCPIDRFSKTRSQRCGRDSVCDAAGAHECGPLGLPPHELVAQHVCAWEIPLEVGVLFSAVTLAPWSVGRMRV